MTSRQVQWRRFAFFDKDTIAENVTLQLGGAEVTCMHTAMGRLYLGDDQGKVTVSDCHLNGRIQRQAYTGPVYALAVAPEGVAAGTGTAKPQQPRPFTSASSYRSGVVVTLGDDSVVPALPLGSYQSGGGVGAAAGGTSATAAGGGSRSSFVLKFWAGFDMVICVRTVDVAAQTRDPGQLQQPRLTTVSSGLSRLTAFAVTSDAMQVACGFADGTALLLQKDLARSPLQPAPAPLLIQPGEDNPAAVTALYFSKGQGGSGVPQMKLLVGYDLDDREEGRKGGIPAPGSLGLLSYDTRTDAEPLILDELGCKEGCSAFGQSTQEMVVGRKDGVYFFSSEDRGGAAGFEGTKQHVGCLWNYILVVSQDSRSARHTINVYDMRNKLVAFHVLLPQGQAVKRIACQGERPDATTAVEDGSGVEGGGGLAFILTDRNILFRLRERDTPSKLDLLFRKNLYPMAISLAYASDHDVSEILGIYRMYGDHLYKKGDFEGAMQQYKSTIGHLDPSYVIRRFLDAQRIGLLTSYLEALHDAGQASSDHTTLLLNCHTKLKDVEKLDRFIHPGEEAAEAPGGSGPITAGGGVRAGAGGSTGGGGAASANFDVVTAIRVLKSAGHADHAAELARRHREHDWFLRIQLERSQPDYQGALAYIASLPFAEASEQLRRRGKPLVTALPEDTTGVLMALCTGRYSRRNGEIRGGGGGGEGGAGGPGAASKASHASTSKSERSPTASSNNVMASAEDFVHLYVDEPKWLRIFLTYVLREGGRAGPAVADTLLELLLREWARAPGSAGAEGAGARGSSAAAAAKKQRESEIMALLDNPRAGYDADHALVLVQMLNFKPGQLYLYEKLYMTDLVLEHYVDTGDHRNMMRMCRKEGSNNPDLWVQVLTHLVNNASSLPHRDGGRPSPTGNGNNLPPVETDDDAGGVSWDEEEGQEGGEGTWDDVRELLALIERDQVLPPLQVVNILAQNPSLPLWVTRDFLPRYLAGAASAANADAAAAGELRESTRKMRAEIQSLRATVQSSSRAGSRIAMALPSFLGSDQGIVGWKVASSLGVPATAGAGELGGLGGEQAKIHDIKAAQARSAVDHEQFFKGLEEATDGFGQVASYFGKGVLS